MEYSEDDTIAAQEDLKAEKRLATRAAPHPLAMLQKMVEAGADPDALKKMMDLAERWEAKEAAANYAASITGFQADCGMVPKLRAVKRKDGAEMYRYANFEDAWSVARPHLKAHRIGVAFSTPPGTDPAIWHMIVHLSVGSHTRDYPFCGPEMSAADLVAYAKGKPGGMNVEQARGEQLAYRKRHCFCAALGIVVCDEDNDMAQPNTPIGEEDQAKILRMIEDTDSNLEAFLAWCRQASGAEVDAVCEIPQSLLPKVLALLRQKKAGVKGGAA